MGNQDSDLKKTIEIGEKRLREYWNSKEVSIRELVGSGSIDNTLRKGDIISRKLQYVTESSTSRSASYSNSGLMIHYAIYAGPSTNNMYYIIEKTQNSGRENPIKLTEVDVFELMQWYLLIDSRYYDTYEMAKKIMDDHLDGGYSFSHANCEHFVTFCLCRHTFFSRSRQVSPATAIRDAFALFSVPSSQLLKIVSHPFYLIGGDSTLSQRMIKAALPFGGGIDEDGIAKGDKFLIGFSVRDIPVKWYRF
jgi:hypothetical protein